MEGSLEVLKATLCPWRLCCNICWSLMWIEKMVLIFQFMHQPSKEDFQAAYKKKLFFFYISSGVVTVSIGETRFWWNWPSFALLLCCQSSFQTYSFYDLLAQTHPSSYQYSLDAAKGILKVQKGNGYQPIFLETLVSVFVFRIINFWEILNSLSPPLLYWLFQETCAYWIFWDVWQEK